MKDLTAAYYEQDHLWGNPPAPYQLQVFADIQSILPSDIKNMLDVGCGDGFITNHLNLPEQKTGLDISASALKYVRHDRAIGNITSIPFADRSFDLVMTNDTIEHIPEVAYASALQELQRVSSRYILVTVPFMENLHSQLTICENCGWIYHINHHQRAFGVKELLSLFDGFIPHMVVFTGEHFNAVEDIQSSFRAHLAPAMAWDKTICPNCQQNRSVAMMTKAQYAPILDQSWLLPQVSFQNEIPSRNECCVLFIRQGASTAAEGKIQEQHPNIGIRVTSPDQTSRLFSGQIQQNGENLFIQLPPEQIPAPEQIWLEYQHNGTTYRLSQPSKDVDDMLSLPLWFTPAVAPHLSPSLDAQHSRAIAHIIRILNQDVQSLQTLQREQDGMQSNLDLLKGDIGLLRVDTGLFQGDVGLLRGDIGLLKDDTDLLRSDISLLKGDTGLLKDDMSLLRGDVSLLQGDIGALKEWTKKEENLLSLKENQEQVRRESFLRTYKEELTATHFKINITRDLLFQVNARLTQTSQSLLEANNQIANLALKNEQIAKQLRQAMLIGALLGAILLVLLILLFQAQAW